MENIERAYKKILSAKKSILREESVENKFKEIERELKIIEKRVLRGKRKKRRYTLQSLYP